MRPNEELLKEIADAVQRYKDEQAGREPEDDPVVEDELVEQREHDGEGHAPSEEEAAAADGTTSVHGRPTRRRATVQRYGFEPVLHVSRDEHPLPALCIPPVLNNILNSLTSLFTRKFGITPRSQYL